MKKWDRIEKVTVDIAAPGTTWRWLICAGCDVPLTTCATCAQASRYYLRCAACGGGCACDAPTMTQVIQATWMPRSGRLRTNDDGTTRAGRSNGGSADRWQREAAPR